jgi:hypothetical protein
MKVFFGLEGRKVVTVVSCSSSLSSSLELLSEENILSEDMDTIVVFVVDTFEDVGLEVFDEVSDPPDLPGLLLFFCFSSFFFFLRFSAYLSGGFGVLPLKVCNIKGSAFLDFFSSSLLVSSDSVFLALGGGGSLAFSVLGLRPGLLAPAMD